MILYHVDRSGHLATGMKIDLVKNFEKLVPEYYFEGLSSHGVHYYLGDFKSKDDTLEAVFEYERRLHYSDKFSRLTSFYASDANGVLRAIEKRNLDEVFYKIYEIEVSDDCYQKYVMNLVRGWNMESTIYYVRCYWKNKKDEIFKADEEPVYEYLIKLPVTIGKEVTKKELELIVSVKQNEDLMDSHFLLSKRL